MTSSFNETLNAISGFVWGWPLMILLIGTGAWYTFLLRGLQFTFLPHALWLAFIKRRESDGKGDISHFQALMTALAATVGTGNIVGVATAIAVGGPGAVFWLWLTGLVGMVTKYSEALLAVKFRIVAENGKMAGGPMYAMKNGISNKFIGRTLAGLFAVFVVISSFGIGNMTQANSISSALLASYAIPTWIVGGIITLLSLAILLRGIQSIGRVSSLVVPFMALFYFVAAVIVIVVNASALPAGIAEMFSMAFSFDSVAGGVGGSMIANAMRWGVARGVFSNEAGLGSAPIAAAAARTDHPSRQGYVNMTGTFFDTMIVCMLTGLVIASSGMLGTVDPATGKLVSGAQLTILAFGSVFGDYAKHIVSFSLALFAFSTILGWEYYGEKALEYLIKARSVIMGYRVIFSLITFIGATTTLEIVWNFSDTMNGLMAIPNLICLVWLSNDIAKECFEYEESVVRLEKEGQEIDCTEEFNA